ncbi:MAG: hypothetical protein ACD_28C00337G0001, partial [uncultured bacterium]
MNKNNLNSRSKIFYLGLVGPGHRTPMAGG